MFFEFDAGSEFGDAASGNLDDTTSLGVATVAGFALRDGEGSEADERNAVAFLQGAGYGVNKRIDGGGSSGFGM